ncbi:ZIP family metal transporter [Aeoliella sp.]|uniref:ZIP family metal transporter n=1 Tax=Aeoliella sp. TaxID=2795800 RepID=UPI003CCBCAAA
MLTALQWVYLVIILLCAFAGGYIPLSRPERARLGEGFPLGEAFSSGVFLALSLTMMLPSAFVVFRQAVPDMNYPWSSAIAIVAFLAMLAMEHLSGHYVSHEQPASPGATLPAAIPIVLTAMIAMPSFFLGAMLGMSDPDAAALIFIAIILHKGTAAFALALAMVRSTLSRGQTLLLFTAFASITPLGIVAGGLAEEYITDSALVVKAVVLSLGAGTFLYMGTLHEMKRATLIQHCCRPSCYVALIAGLAITGLVRWIVGEAHQL